MAQGKRRMFSLKVIDTDEFLDMPQSTQLLYFHLSLRADDDGFVANPKRILKISGSNDDDMKVLTAKRFVIPFESGICVIRHWRVHNYIQKDRYEETQHLEEKSQLGLAKNKEYLLSSGNSENMSLLKDNSECIQNVNKMDAQIRLNKIKLGKDKEEEAPSEKPKNKISYLLEIPEEDLKEFSERFNITEVQIKDKAEDLHLYCQSKGRKYSNYKSFLLNCLKKDFGVKPSKITDKYKNI
jgi:hypothetical protein